MNSIVKFVKSNDLTFIGVTTKITPTGKFYDGLYNEWNLISGTESINFYNNKNRFNLELKKKDGTTYIRKSKSDNQILIKGNLNFIIYDTDDEEQYNKFINILKELYLYDENNITLSFRGRESFYKRHFWFLTSNDDIFRTKVPQKCQQFKGFDIFYGENCQVAEFISTSLDSENLDMIDYGTYCDILNKMGFKNSDNNVVYHNDNYKLNSEFDLYMECGLKHEIFKKMKGYKMWLNIGFIITNEKSNDGEKYFIEVSKQLESDKFNEQNVKNFYSCLNKTVLQTSKKPLKLGSLIKYYKDTDIKLFELIQNDVDKFKKIKDTINENLVFKVDNFDTVYFNELKLYSTKKKYFEYFVCKVLRPQPLFIYSENENKFNNSLLYSENDIKATFNHLKSGIFKTTNQNEQKETKFINEWLEDKNIKLYNRMDFLPFNGVKNLTDINKTVFNLFNGYNPDITTQFQHIDKLKILKPFIDLLFELVGAENKSYDYFINFLAHLIKKPAERIPVCFIFKSKQGVGKNMMLDCVGNLIGKHHYITSSNPQDFFGDYAEGFFRKLLVNLNECEGKDTFDFEGRIKSFTTEPTITLNPKFVRQTTINNYARLIITTNKPNPIPIDIRSKDRRFIVFQSTDKYLNDKYGTLFWTKLKEHFEKPEFISSLYDFFNTRDIEQIKWIEDRPITCAYLEMCKQYIPVEALFMEDYIDNLTINKNKQYQVSTIELYEKYIMYCKIYGFVNDKTFQANINKFTNRLQELELGILKIKTSSIRIYRFNPKETYDIMIKKNWIVKLQDEPAIEQIKNIKEDDFNDYFDY